MKNIYKVLIAVFIIFVIVFSIYIAKRVTSPKEEPSIPVNNETPTDPINEALKDYGFSTAEIATLSPIINENAINSIVKQKMDKTIVVNLVKEKYYLNSNLERYYTYASNNPDKSTQEVVKDVNSQIDQVFYQDVRDSDTSQGILMIVNKFYQVDENFNGIDLIDLPPEYERYGRQVQINRETYEHYLEMLNDARALNLNFLIYSAYRSYDTQTKLYNNYVNQDGQEAADTYSARAGFSEHQTGLALDLRTLETDYFETTDEFTWLKENAHKYGFILRYKEGEEYITGYQYEPWHFRYCGIECATYIYENNLDFEEYYEYVIKNQNH